MRHRLVRTGDDEIDPIRFRAQRSVVAGWCCEVGRAAAVRGGTRIARSVPGGGPAQPRGAVAGVTPHKGDGGTCGREEIDIIEPAVRELAERGLPVQGPFPADTIFLKARDGELDAIVTMYHDQGQIAMKTLGFERGITMMGGLPYPVATPAQGTAFDIAGKGIANAEAIRRAFHVVADMASRAS